MHSPPKGWDTPDSPYRPEAGVDVVVFPSFPNITQCVEAKLTVGGQYGRAEPEGAFTGDVSMKMLKDIGCTHVLCGHSERRKFHGETDVDVVEQVIATLELGLHPILCVGESQEERKKGKAQEIIKKQLKKFLILQPSPSLPAGQAGLRPASNSAFSIAYEPVWAIGSGVNALPDDAQKMHAFIRSLLPKETRESTRIIYGGSVNDLNAADFLGHTDIDGLLVGGTSLDPQKFSVIVDAAHVDPSP